MRVIGTAGHVDHGKSTLVQCLTGIDPDRWQEEKTRGLTIDLGFAWFDLPSGETVGIVDVPGHSDFIENMLAGVAGIDAALLIIAADEGVMPQTREHLAILHLLGIAKGLIVLTKTDLITDMEWLELIETDIREVVQNTVLEDADIVRASAKTRDGIDSLISKLANLLQNLPQRTDYKQPRLPVDRVFSVEGFGTVITGTLSGGTLKIGDTIEIQPDGLQGRIRGLQSYKQEINLALPGSRVAVNISGIHKDEISRGDVLSYPGQLVATSLIDARFHYLGDVEKPLEHNAEVKFFSGASETLAHVRLLNNEILTPNTEGWVQLRLRDSLPLTQNDRFILRYPSPPQTIGGGIIVNPTPERRWKRFRQAIINQLQTRLEGTPTERVLQAANVDTPQKYAQLQKTTAYSDEELDDAIETALNDNHLILFADGTYWTTSRVQTMIQSIQNMVANYHKQYPLRLGIPREELRNRLGIKNALLTSLLEIQDVVIANRDLLKNSHHEIHFSPPQKQSIATLYEQMKSSPYAPLSYKEAVNIIGDDVMHALIDLNEIVQVSTDVIFMENTYEELVRSTLSLIEERGQVDVKDVRDSFNTSRRYAVALLEHLDSIGITRRVGDIRVKGHHAK